MGEYQPDPIRELTVEMVDLVAGQIKEGLTLEELRERVAKERQAEDERVAALNDRVTKERIAAEEVRQEEMRAKKSSFPLEAQEAFDHFVEAMVEVYHEEYEGRA